MTITTRIGAMTKTRKAALIAGVLYLVTFVTSIPVLGMYDKALNDSGFLFGAGSDKIVLVGAIFEVICGLTGIGTAVFLYSILKRHSPAGALGFVTSRVIEAAMIMVGVLSVLSIVTLHNDVAGTAGADAGSLVTSWHSLVAVHDWSFLLGPGVMPAVNALCFATVLYRSRLVPRIIPTIGLIGAPVLLASSTAVLFGAYDQVSHWSMLTALPIATWEFSVGVYMMVKGFKATAVAETPALYDVAA